VVKFRYLLTKAVSADESTGVGAVPSGAFVCVYWHRCASLDTTELHLVITARAAGAQMLAERKSCACCGLERWRSFAVKSE
jgi:hypothetical protein